MKRGDVFELDGAEAWHGRKLKPGWYFLDETECESGPFSTKEEAERVRLTYIHWLEHGH